MDFVSLLGGIVLGAAGAALLDTKSGSGMLGDRLPVPAPPEGPRLRGVHVPTPTRMERRPVRYPVMNPFGGQR